VAGGFLRREGRVDVRRRVNTQLSWRAERVVHEPLPAAAAAAAAGGGSGTMVMADVVIRPSESSRPTFMADPWTTVNTYIIYSCAPVCQECVRG